MDKKPDDKKSERERNVQSFARGAQKAAMVNHARYAPITLPTVGGKKYGK